MCGITGFFAINKTFDRDTFSKANNIVRHRGPDDFGYITVRNDWTIDSWKSESMADYHRDDTIGALGFRRLSIIDLSAQGRQPMSDSSGNLWIVFNGEIYNYIEIRKQLIKLGYFFKSESDTEVILYSYKEWGVNCLEHFNGMWAFCLLDKKKRKLFCARDHLGIKPFYYYKNEHCFAFGSEIKQLIELLPGACKNINNQLIFDFLAMGSFANETSETYFTDIFKLDAGAYCEINFNGHEKITLKKQFWWQLPSNEISLDEAELYNNLYETLLDSVRIRLRSDVPQGTALSGGVDSSIITSLVNILQDSEALANIVFSIKSNIASKNDGYFTKILIESLPVTSYSKDFDKTANIEELPNLLWHQEEPVQNASIFGSWQLYKFIREMNITVNLDGQGADEILFGYNDYPFRSFLALSIKDFGLTHTLRQIDSISKVYRSSKYELYIQLIYGMAIRWFKKKHYKLKRERKWIDESFFTEQKNKSFLWNHAYFHEGLPFNSHLKKDAYVLIKHTNLPGILRQVDRNSMAFSVEARLPYLDHRFVELCFSINPSLILKNGFTKYPLRKAMAGKIIDEVLWRTDKSGFVMPEYEIIKKKSGFAIDMLNTLKNDGRINYPMVKKEITTLLDSPKNYNNILWRFLVYSIWKKQFQIL